MEQGAPPIPAAPAPSPKESVSIAQPPRAKTLAKTTKPSRYPRSAAVRRGPRTLAAREPLNTS
jgi:hypothetical protein